MEIIEKINSVFLKRLITALAVIFVINLFNSAWAADQSKNDTLAVIGRKIITSAEFVKAYKEKLMKIGLTDNSETRSKYLQNLADDELLINYAKQSGLDKTDSARNELKRIRLQGLLNAYSLKHISPSINVSEADLQQLFVKLNTKIKVSHIYASTKEKADSLYTQLISGKSFEELAKENFIDGQLKNTGGSLGYISLDEMDPDFEKAAYSMHPGDISKPVKTVEGYSIIRVEDIQGNPLVTENEFLKAHDRLISFARKRAFEEASRQYAHSLSNELNIKFNDLTLSKLFTAINKNTVEILIENPSVISPSDLNKIIVTSAQGNWTIKNLISEMSIVTEKQKKFIRTKENLQDFITGLVNRKYITRKAYEEGLDNSPEFQSNVQFNFDTYLLTTVENKLKEQIIISPDSVKSYYDKNLNLFTSKPEIRLSSILLDNPVMADSIKLRLESGEQFETLAQKYSVQTITAQAGGDMGYFKKDELGELADKIFSLEAGQWAGPFVDNGKGVFLKCTEYKKPTVKPLNECSEDINNTLVSFQWFNIRDGFVESLKLNTNYKLFTQKLYELKL